MSSPLLGNAKLKQSVFEAVNQTVTVDGTGKLSGKKVVLFLAPLRNDKRNLTGDISKTNYESLRASYQALFKAATEENVKSIAIPCFSTGAGALDTKKTAKIAVDEAAKYTQEHTELNVQFVPYREDWDSIDAYNTELAQKYESNEADFKHISLWPGAIEEADAESIVCPIREGYNLNASGVTARAVDRAASARFEGLSGIKEPAEQKIIKIESGNLVYQLGDITENDAEYIVNAANPRLEFGGGVCGAIFKSAGVDVLSSECQKVLLFGGQESIEVGKAVLTGAGKLQRTNGTKGIIHAVGPDMRSNISPEEAEGKLKSAYKESLEIAKEKGAKSVAFPLISTGIYGYFLDEGIKVAEETIRDFLSENSELEMDVRLTTNSKKTYEFISTSGKTDVKAIPKKLKPKGHESLEEL